MSFIPRILGLGLLSVLVLLLVMACESSKKTNEYGSPNRIKGEAIAAPESRQVVHFTDSSTEYTTPRNILARAFIRQFNDGTVIDKVQVRKAPSTDATAAPKYYIIGTGLNNGMYRAMALPLTPGGDNAFFLRPSAERYILTSNGCTACFFNFENGRIVGTSCTENSGGSFCDLKVEPTNAMFAPEGMAPKRK